MITEDIIYPDWEVPSFIRAIQTTRKGGYSLGKKFGEFNLSKKVGDEESNVTLNISLLKKILPNNLNLIEQVHGIDIIELSPNPTTLQADASYTRNIGEICTVLTADCLPILITDTKGSFVSAIHAGWKGLGRGIIENSIKQINSPNELIAWLGPCISQEKMEVGKEVYNFFQRYDKNTCAAFKEKSKDKLSLNLTSAAKIKLMKLGVQLIYGNSITQHYCTFKEPDKFFSYRRDRITGRMASLIWIDK